MIAPLTEQARWARGDRMYLCAAVCRTTDEEGGGVTESFIWKYKREPDLPCGFSAVRQFKLNL